MYKKRGYSIIEILVVIGVFAVLGILATQSITLSLRSSKKSDSINIVKQELDYAASTIEKLLQTASVVVVGVDCLTTNATSSVGFRNSYGARGDVACIDTTANFYILNNDKRIASSSGETINFSQRLTSGNVDITSCGFSCFTQNSKMYIDFNVTAGRKDVTSEEGSTFSTSRKILIQSAIKK